MGGHETGLLVFRADPNPSEVFAVQDGQYAMLAPHAIAGGSELQERGPAVRLT